MITYFEILISSAKNEFALFRLKGNFKKNICTKMRYSIIKRENNENIPLSTSEVTVIGRGSFGVSTMLKFHKK